MGVSQAVPGNPGSEKHHPVSKHKVLLCLVSMKTLKVAFSSLLATSHLLTDLCSLLAFGNVTNPGNIHTAPRQKQ